MREERTHHCVFFIRKPIPSGKTKNNCFKMSRSHSLPNEPLSQSSLLPICLLQLAPFSVRRCGLLPIPGWGRKSTARPTRRYVHLAWHTGRATATTRHASSHNLQNCRETKGEKCNYDMEAFLLACVDLTRSGAGRHQTSVKNTPVCERRNKNATRYCSALKLSPWPDWLVRC